MVAGAPPSLEASNLDVRGISYMVDEVSAEVARTDLCAIRERLHATAVILIGTDITRLVAAAEHALRIGLDAWIEPHPVDLPYRVVLRDLAATARAAEELRRRHPGRVTLVVGCEFSLHLAGMIPGRPEAVRLLLTMGARHAFRRRIDRKVNHLLAGALAVTRPVFHGPVTYASASWEDVDWSGFDLAGVNLYRSASNAPAFERMLADRLRLTPKPLVITEFGCGSHVGGAQRGAGSFKIVNWLAMPPRIRAGHVRSERIQAAYVGELIETYHRHGVHGCFVYTFALRDYPHLPDPRHDLDMAAFGVVKVDPDDRARWSPKLAFHEVAGRYAELAAGGRRATAAVPRVADGPVEAGVLQEQRRFHLHRELALMVDRYHIFADDGRGNPGALVAFAEQTRAAGAEEVTLYTGPGKEHVLFRFARRAALELVGAFDVVDAEGASLGRLTKVFRWSLLRSAWRLEQWGGAPLLVHQRTFTMAVLRRLWSLRPLRDLPFPWREHFDLTRDRTVIASVEKTTFQRDRSLVRIGPAPLDRRLVLAQAVALDTSAGVARARLRGGGVGPRTARQPGAAPRW